MLRSRRPAVLVLLLPLLIALAPAARIVHGQEGVGIPLGDAKGPFAKRTDLFCAGFITKKKKLSDWYQIIGGEREDEINFYTTTNVVYLNYGAKHGATVGESLYVMRPRGKYENPFTGKDLGYYFEEYGMVRIIAVERKLSIAEIVVSCEGIQLGDLVKPFDQYVSPPTREFIPLNRWDLPSGKLSGQIALARNSKEWLVPNDVVYIDIGDEKGVKSGQYYTIYRRPGRDEGPVGREHWWDDDDYVDARDDGYRSDRYRGSDIVGINSREYDTNIFDWRVGVPRKVIGELIVIRVEEKAATCIITRTTQEANVGDYVELQ
jgi:hypothetical protein